MDKSDMELSSDWDIVSSTGESSEKDEEIGLPIEVENKEVLMGSQVEDVGDQENIVANDSSSDIDVIEENLEEIDAFVERLKSIPIRTAVDTDDNFTGFTISTDVPFTSRTTVESSNEATPSDVRTEPLESEESEKSLIEEASSETVLDSSFVSGIGGRSMQDWISFIWEYFQSLSGFQISSLLGLTFCIYFCITINQTNIIALQEKGNVVSQMEKLVDDLRQDNKHLQEKMLSEMKNDKLVSSFEHQIRELKKENSKLNHMLHDVVKVLEEQKDTQEKLLVKKETEYQAPFKKEINKLKDHINKLKIDNEELQKQLVRIRYASYSQGSKHGTEKERDTHKNEHTEAGKYFKHGKEEKLDEEINEDSPLNIFELKKWNALLDQFAKEYGLLKDDDSTTEKSEKWNWREELKKKIKKPANFVSDLLLFNKKMINDVYKSASEYISEAQENMQSLIESLQQEGITEDKKSTIWDVIHNLGDKWANVKGKIISTYHLHKDCPSKNEESKSKDVNDISSSEPSVESPEYSKEHPHNQNPEDADNPAQEKWFFKRAQLREKLRDKDNEEPQNWFLRRKRSLFGGTVMDLENAADRNLRDEI